MRICAIGLKLLLLHSSHFAFVRRAFSSSSLSVVAGISALRRAVLSASHSSATRDPESGGSPSVLCLPFISGEI